MRTLLALVLVCVSLAALGLNLVANGLDAGSMIPPPKCGDPACQCGCNAGQDCKCAE